MRHIFNSISEVQNKAVSQLTSFEQIVIAYDCSHRLKPLYEYTTQLMSILDKTTDLWNKNIVKIQNKNIKMAELYEQAFKLESSDKSEVKASVNYLSQKIRYIRATKSKIDENSTEDILNYLKEKKSHLTEISREAAEIDKLIKGISNARTKFVDINEIAKQNLNKFSAIVYAN